MTNEERMKQSAKVFKSLSEDTVALLKEMVGKEQEQIEFSNIEQFEEFQVLVKEGYIIKDFRKYQLNDSGKLLLEDIALKVKSPEKFEEMIAEETDENVISISYKKHIMEEDIIENTVSKFGVSKDGLPIVVVEEETYANLIHRKRGQHWKQYVAEDVRQLIRQKKLTRFYVESKKTGRQYLYVL